MGDQPSSGVDRLSGLLQWWGIPEGTVAPDVSQLVRVVADVQKAYLDAASRQLESAFASNDRIARSARNVLTVQKPADFARLQVEIATTMTQAAADYANTWVRLCAEVETICRALSPESKRANPVAVVSETAPARPARPSAAPRDSSHTVAAA